MQKMLDITANIDLKYRLEASSYLKYICEDFFLQFGVTDFIYSQFDQNYNQIDLCTNERWIKYYFKNRHNLDISIVENMWKIEDNIMTFWNWPPLHLMKLIYFALFINTILHMDYLFLENKTTYYTSGVLQLPEAIRI